MNHADVTSAQRVTQLIELGLDRDAAELAVAEAEPARAGSALDAFRDGETAAETDREL